MSVLIELALNPKVLMGLTLSVHRELAMHVHAGSFSYTHAQGEERERERE